MFKVITKKASAISEKLFPIWCKILPVMACIYTMGLTTMSTCMVGADAKDLMELVIKIIAKLIIASGVLFFVMGLIKWASSHAEGDGPGQNKAVGMIVAGITLFALSLILTNVAPELASNIDTTI